MLPHWKALVIIVIEYTGGLAITALMFYCASALLIIGITHDPSRECARTVIAVSATTSG